MPDPTLDRAWAFLRSHTRGELRFDEHVRPLRYVPAPEGDLVAPVMVAMLQAPDTVLFVPEMAEDAMEVMVTLAEFAEEGPGGALADRWRIYHGDPPDVRWVRLDIDAARFDGRVIDGDALQRPNPLATAEAELCRLVNREHGSDLPHLCLRFGGAEAERPVMVGIDPLGLDVRRRFEVIRVPAPEPMPSAEDARRVLEAMLREATAAEGRL